MVEIPRPLWWLILNGIILNIRPAKSAAKYAAIWTPEGSPLKVHTERQAKLLRGCARRSAATASRRRLRPCATASRRSPDVLDQLKAAGCNRILRPAALPAIRRQHHRQRLRRGRRLAAAHRNLPELRFVRNFHDHPGYIAALARQCASTGRSTAAAADDSW